MRNERERLLDILEAIERIEKYAAKGKPVAPCPMIFKRDMRMFPGQT